MVAVLYKFRIQIGNRLEAGSKINFRLAGARAD
jgi:hypothetical protein